MFNILKFQLESRRAYDFKKQLRVTFVGEDGIDEGGVQKEFFKLAMDTIFDPEYGIYININISRNVCDESWYLVLLIIIDSRLCWFTIDNTRDINTVEEYRMLGMFAFLMLYRDPDWFSYL
jgi:ubiquitin-protein ligase E3 A